MKFRGKGLKECGGSGGAEKGKKVKGKNSEENVEYSKLHKNIK